MPIKAIPPTTTPTTSPIATLTSCEPIVGFVVVVDDAAALVLVRVKVVLRGISVSEADGVEETKIDTDRVAVVLSVVSKSVPVLNNKSELISCTAMPYAVVEHPKLYAVSPDTKTNPM